MRLDENLFNNSVQPASELEERKEKRVKDYRRYAGLSDDEVITEDNIDKWALNRICRENNSDEEKMKSELTEDVDDQTLADAAKASKEIDDAKVVTNKGQIESVLD